MTTDEVRLIGRAKNAVLTHFENQLSIPKIYMDTEWDGHKVDVLAINRDGVGDVHVVRLFADHYFQSGSPDLLERSDTETALLEELSVIPAQFKYIGFINGKGKGSDYKPIQRIKEKTFAPDGIGRVGFLLIDLSQEGEPQILTVIKPERFRAKIAKLADEYVQQHEADWEIRA